MGFRQQVCFSVVVLMLLLSATAHGAERTVIKPRSATDPEALPFSGAVLVGETLYLSGDIGLDENGKIPDTAEAEARLVLNSIQATLKEAGMTMDDLAFVQVFCTDVANYDAFNSVYRNYFTKEFPARAFIGAGTLLFNARFEVQAIAVKR
jgi:2-iminobutanoate/2-iminopropanoate deaminase